MPTQLVAAFRATLEEVTGADLILHVRDMSNAANQAQKTQVIEVLTELGVIDGEGGDTNIPILEVWNKVDLLPADEADALREAAAADGDAVVVSALSGEGIEALTTTVGEILTQQARELDLTLPASDGRRIAWLHAHGEVLADEDAGESGGAPMRHLVVRLNPKELGQFETL